MYVGASNNAQVGANVSDVTSYITSDDNTVSFGDDGDSMMAANAFLMVEYGGLCGDVDGDGEITMGDVGLLWPHVFFPEEYPLSCR